MQWSLNQLKSNPGMHAPMLDLLKRADFWIRDFSLEEADFPPDIVRNLPLSNEAKEQLLANRGASVKTKHALRNKNQTITGEVLFDLMAQESSGTQRFFELATPLVNTLSTGKVLYIDEFEAHLHPDISRFIVSLFKSKANKNNAQLAINTHDTSLMGLLERDDIVFVEKNYAEESVVSAMSDKSARLDESFEKRYRQGLYGAKPQVETEG
jgi:hypothetical protein